LALLGNCTQTEVPEDKRHEWTHAFRFAAPHQQEIVRLCELLKTALSLTAKRDLDFAIALDWYKDPVGDDPMKWPNTPSGELIYRSKYYGPGHDRTRARRQLVDKYAALIRQHPILRDCPAIITVPGHKADGESFGEKLADKVASETGKTLIRTLSPGGTRPQAKEGASQIANGHFAMPHEIDERVIILDDVYGSGATMAAVGKAARRSGARRVFGLAAVRRMRS
jgi:hypothetical protein